MDQAGAHRKSRDAPCMAQCASHADLYARPPFSCTQLLCSMRPQKGEASFVISHRDTVTNIASKKVVRAIQRDACRAASRQSMWGGLGVHGI